MAGFYQVDKVLPTVKNTDIFIVYLYATIINLKFYWEFLCFLLKQEELLPLLRIMYQK